jgi:predicted nucleic acid-binding protein
MRLIVDTNRVIAALVKDSTSRKILLSDKINFLTIEITKQEIEEHRRELLYKTRLTDEQLNLALSLLFSRIFVVSDIVVENKMDEAKEIMDATDPDDTPFIVLALAVENDGIWSDDKHFKQQTRIRIWETKDLLMLIRKGLV